MTKNKIKYETDVLSICFLAPQILENRVKDKAVLDVKEVREAKRVNMELSEGKPYAYLAIKGEFSEVTKEAKELLASKEIAINTVAKALLIQSLADRIMANFYLTLNKPYVTTKIFTDKIKAVEWLQSQIEKFNSK